MSSGVVLATLLFFLEQLLRGDGSVNVSEVLSAFRSVMPSFEMMILVCSLFSKIVAFMVLGGSEYALITSKGCVAV